MGQNNTTPQFQFDSLPPFTYEEFKSQHFDRVLGVLGGPGGDFLKRQTGQEREFLTRLFYLMIVTKLQNPDMAKPQMLYAVYYGLLRYVLDQGATPEEAREQLAQVPWDSLPGLDIYDSETTNAIAKRAFADAVAGRPQSPLH